MVLGAPHKMKCVAEVADKAVSTEDLWPAPKRRWPDGNGGGGGVGKDEGGGPTLEFVRLEAVLAALVQSKVISVKASATGVDGPGHGGGARPRNFPNAAALRDDPTAGHLLSSSTVSSRKEDGLHHRHHHHHHHGRRKSRHHHYGHRASDASGLLASGLFPKRRLRHRHRHRHHHHHHLHHQQFLHDEEELYQLQETAFCASTVTLAPPATAGPSDVCVSCCPSPVPSQSKILRSHYDADFVALNMDLEEEAFLSLYEEAAGDDDEDEDAGAGPVGAVRHQRRKRRRRKRGYAGGGGRAKRTARVIDPEDLPKRARWTIIATACLLLLMSVLLVGVTLRMAPIIDEMVRKQNEQHQNSLSRDEGVSSSFFNVSSNHAASTSSNVTSAHAL